MNKKVHKNYKSLLVAFTLFITLAVCSIPMANAAEEKVDSTPPMRTFEALVYWQEVTQDFGFPYGVKTYRTGEQYETISYINKYWYEETREDVSNDWEIPFGIYKRVNYYRRYYTE